MSEPVTSEMVQDQFNCPVCLDLLKDPVTIPCGHSYCMACVAGCWEKENETGVVTCPQCRENFHPRPVLKKNFMMEGLIENLKTARFEQSTLDDSFAGPNDEVCDFCVGKKRIAIKSCLSCLASFCEYHLRPHYQFNALKKHTLVDATTRLKTKICPVHDKVFEIYCRYDKQCICYLCTMDQHSRHKVVSAAAERTEQQKVLKEIQLMCQQRAQEREKEVYELRQAIESLKGCIQMAVPDIEKVFIQMINLMSRRCAEVKREFTEQTQAYLCEAEELLKALEQEVCNLKKRDTELGQLAHSEDHIHFLKSFPSLNNLPESEDLPNNIPVAPQISFGKVVTSLSELKDNLEVTTKEELHKIAKLVNDVQVTLPLYPEAREQFLKYSTEIALDGNTAHATQIVYNVKGLRYQPNSYYYPSPPVHPERYTSQSQVLCKQPLQGRSYFEVEWKGNSWTMAVAYKQLDKDGKISDQEFGNNAQSWSLSRGSSTYIFKHNSISINVPLPTLSVSCLGMYLDHKAGTLSFYSVGDTMTLLHKVQTKFVLPLYPGFRVGSETSLKIR